MACLLDLARTMSQDARFGSLGTVLLDVPGAVGADPLGSRRLFVHEIADRLAAAITSPTVLAFEDLQWADELSLEVVGELARRGRELPLLLIAAYRADELPMGSSHREWRSRLLNQRLAVEARLAPLDQEQTALVTSLILATGLPAPRAVAAGRVRADGRDPTPHRGAPRGARRDARTDGRAIRNADVPDTIEDAVLARVARLSDDARAVARAGAVIGRCFVPEVLAGVLDRPVQELDAPLEELVAASVLYPFQFVDRGFYDFRHQLLRDAVYGSVRSVELRRLHARAGEFGTELVGASEIHASVHFERAGLRPQAYRAARAGAEAAAALSSRRESFELYRRAATNAPIDLSADELASLYSAYAEAALAVDDVSTAAEAAERARLHYLAAGRPIDAAAMITIQVILARRDVHPISERTAMLDRQETELLALPRTPERDDVLGNLQLHRAMTALDEGRLDAAQRLGAEARAVLVEAGETELGAVDFVQGSIAVVAGRVEDGLEAVLAVARDARERQLEETGVTAFRLAAAFAVRAMDYPAAQVGLAEGLRYADEIEQSYCRHVLAATAAHAAWAAGRWDEAVQIAEIELVERGSRRGTLGSRDVLGFIAFGRGDVERARSLLTDSLQIGTASGEVELILPAMWGLAETALVAGDPRAALETCEAALELALAAGERALLVPFAVTGVRAAQAARRPDAAEAWLTRVADVLSGWDRARTALAHADGLARLAAGSTVSARERLEAAVRGWDEIGRSWEAAWARLDLAVCLIRGNRHLDALPVLAEVRASAVRLQSDPLRGRADELAGTARRRGLDDEPWWPLTAREFEIAGHIASGLTNAAIAAELGVSPRTVGAHVEHILAKLGATRRAEIASWATTVTQAPAGTVTAGARHGVPERAPVPGVGTARSVAGAG